MDELLGLPYIIEKLVMYSFQPNLNLSEIPHVTPDMSKQCTKI